MMWTRELSNTVMRWWELSLKSLIFKSPEHQIAACLRFAEFILRETEGLIKSSKNEFLMRVLLCLMMLSLEKSESLSCPQDPNSDFYLQKKHYWTERQKRTGG